MVETVIFACILSVFTLFTAFLYSKRIRESRKEYEEAKCVIDDIIVSFNKQLQKQEDRLLASATKISTLSGRDELLNERLNNQQKEVRALAEKLVFPFDPKEVVPRIESLEKRFNEAESSRNSLLQKLAKIEKQRRPPKETEVRIRSPIPIRREEALAPLTETELKVLQLLTGENGRTGPEIKERINLSREHTARLMKKLYERGYLERSANKIPFTYSLKEEMRKILKSSGYKS